MSKPDIPEYGKKVENESKPEAGTNYPAGKPDTDEDALGGSYHRSPEAVREAKDVEGAAKKARRIQEGNHLDDMTQGHSGINDDGDNE
jgi:hypothetical protein